VQRRHADVPGGIGHVPCAGGPVALERGRRRRRTTVCEVDDAEISALVTRLARPHASGGVVIERAAILAEGADFVAVMDWIIAHAGKPETTLSAAPRRGLHGSRLNDSDGTESRTPRRFVLPAGALL
jgi:hypothetical protein